MGEFLTFLWTFLEYTEEMLCLRTFLKPKVSGKRFLAAFLGYWLASSVFLCAHILSGTPKTLLFLGLTILFSVFTNQGKWYQHIFITVAAVLGCSLLDLIFVYGVCFLSRISAAELMQGGYLYYSVITTAKCVECIVIWQIRCSRKKIQRTPLQNKREIVAAVVPATSFAALLAVFSCFRNDPSANAEVLIACTCIAVGNLAFLVLLHQLEVETDKAQQTILLQQQEKMLLQQLEALESGFREQRQRTHSYRNNLATLGGLLKDGQIQLAEAYLEELLEDSYAPNAQIQCKHPLIGVILNQKYNAAKAAGIEIQIQVNDLSAVALPNQKLAVLLCNLLDNAIEGCCRVEGERKMEVVMLAKTTLQLVVRNTAQPMNIQNGELPTSKNPPEYHGYGIPSIKQILEELGAEYSFSYADGECVFSTELPLKVQEQ